MHHDIWIIDDEVELAESYARYLGDPVPSRIFNSAESALETLDSSPPPRLFITDIRMPGMDGVSMVERLRKQKHHQPVIMLTGYANTADLIRTVPLGVSGFLEKPCDPQLLRQLVETSLQSPSLELVTETLLEALTQQNLILYNLVQSYTHRYIQAENIAYSANAPLHTIPEDIRAYLDSITTQNNLEKQIAELQIIVQNLLTKRANLVQLPKKLNH